MLCLPWAYRSIQLPLWWSSRSLDIVIFKVFLKCKTVCLSGFSKPSKWIDVTFVFIFNASLNALNPSSLKPFSVSKAACHSITLSILLLYLLTPQVKCCHWIVCFQSFTQSGNSIISKVVVYWLFKKQKFFFLFIIWCIMKLYNSDSILWLMCLFSMHYPMKSLHQHRKCCLWTKQVPYSLDSLCFVHVLASLTVYVKNIQRCVNFKCFA